eukprot:TRINITY_DN13498_c0_g1_i1.p1 TRINITY_DN13498_c0_g1~~TRINITY_DN13498_c0_g1_i1.p1  ORF type:complete len:206 (+),score=5.48 TRINITY_DN13498_c0_g1_i1:31-648(+)
MCIRDRDNGFGTVLGHPKITDRFLSCEEGHIISCKQKMIGQFIRMLQIFGPVSVLYHIIPTLIFKRSKVFSRAHFVTIWKKVLTNIVRSWLFFSFLGGIYSCSICVIRNVLKQDYPWSYFVSGCFCGIPLGFEPLEKRSEIVVYTLPRALELLWNMMKERKIVFSIKHGEVLLFCFSMGIIMNAYKSSPATIKSTYRTIIHQLFS